MQPEYHHHKSHDPHWKSYLFLLLIALLAYWPISFQLFSVKNDAIHYFLPVRYMISSSIQHGFFPYWANSFYLGYPIHGDMQSGVWNPFVQFISLFTTYNVTILHIEYLLYIFLAGAGMYKLSGVVTDSRLSRITVASAYMLCGYMLGSGQFINWLASAAFIPFVLYYYQRFLHTLRLADCLKTALFGWLLFVCGYPADSIITIYVLGGLCIGYFIKHRKFLLKDKILIRKLVGYHFILLVATLLLSAPAIISYFDLLPYYSRGSGIGVEEAMVNSFDPRNSLSFISPWSVIANDFRSTSDLTSRSIFIGLFTLVFAVSSFFIKNTGRKIILQIAVIISFLFCLGEATPLRKLCYDLLPGMNTFRHPSHFRLYTILPLLLLAAIAIDQFIKRERRVGKIIRIVSLSMASLLLFFLSISIMTGSAAKLFNLFSAISDRELLKRLLQDLTWKDMLLGSCIFQLLFLIIFLFITRRNKIFPKKTFLAIHTLNIMVNSLLVLPAIFVSKTTPSLVNSLIREKAGFYNPIFYNRTLRENTIDATDHFDEIGPSFFYSQQPALTKITKSPAFLSSMDSFVQTNQLYDYILGKPVAWLSNQTLPLVDTAMAKDSNAHCSYSFSENGNQQVLNSCDTIPGNVVITNVGPGRFTMNVNTFSPGALNLSQAFHHNWTAEINGKPVIIQKANITFMSIPLPKGSFVITWRYKATIVGYAFIVALLTLLSIIILLTIPYIRSFSDNREK